MKYMETTTEHILKCKPRLLDCLEGIVKYVESITEHILKCKPRLLDCLEGIVQYVETITEHILKCKPRLLGCLSPGDREGRGADEERGGVHQPAQAV